MNVTAAPPLPPKMRKKLNPPLKGGGRDPGYMNPGVNVNAVSNGPQNGVSSERLHVVSIRIQPELSGDGLQDALQASPPTAAPEGCVRICVGGKDGWDLDKHTAMIRRSSTSPSGDPFVSKNNGNPYFFYNGFQCSNGSGQSSPSDALDSGTCSDVDGCTPPPLPKKKNSIGSAGSGASTNSTGDVTTPLSLRVTVNGRAGSVTSSAEEHESEDERSSNMSCDSLNSNELDVASMSPPRPPKHLLRHCAQYIVNAPPLPEKSRGVKEIVNEVRKMTLSDSSLESCSPPRGVSPERTVNQPRLIPHNPTVAVEQRTYEDRRIVKVNKTADFDADQYYDFHLNEKEDDDPCKPVEEDTFAGCKDYSLQECAVIPTPIRSSKGTIRGVKNRVRAGVATFLQMHSTKSWKDKEAGKVVVYSTTMGVVRATHQRCVRVKQILRTLLVRFEDKDVFMSREIQAELLERTGHSRITVPQVYVEGQHVGDAETIERLNESGELRKMLKPYKSADACTTCEVCGGYRLLPCAVCNGSKKSVHRNHFTTELVALRCMNCDEVGLVRCYAC